MGVYRRHDRGGGRDYYIRYTDEAGKKRNIKVGPNRRDAEDLFKLKLAEAARRRHLPHLIVGTDSFEAFSREYLNAVEAQYAKAWRGDLRRILRYWREHLGKTPLDRITQKSVIEYRTARLGAGRSPATVNREVAVLRKLFNDAIAWGRGSRNPASGLKALREAQDKWRYLSESEASALVSAAADFIRPFLLLALNTGARRGELLALE